MQPRVGLAASCAPAQGARPQPPLNSSDMPRGSVQESATVTSSRNTQSLKMGHWTVVLTEYTSSNIALKLSWDLLRNLQHHVLLKPLNSII